ncbi:protein Wnt-2b-like [Ursus arctos]|uniref:protein Wnt-2b-like n=1 Tax=Ursus arctos TaxID=9644 RepID=UPI002546F8F5|nr:protein Wnt-2b-like [Ursus arctos]
MGDYLQRCSDGAVQVIATQNGASITAATNTMAVPPGLTLSTLTTPQRYCVLDKAADSLGTAGRVCSKAQTVVKSWAVAEDMTQLESPLSSRVIAHSAGAVWCSARRAEIWQTSILGKAPTKAQWLDQN